MAFHRSELFRRMIEGNPLVLVDAGARGGLDRKWRPLKKAVRVIGFEPDDGECRRLNETAGENHLYLPLAMANKKGKVRINITRNPSCCSILEPDRGVVDRFLAAEELEITGTIEVNADTLDGVVRTNGIRDVDFIKLDTQGTELQILQGAQQALSALCVFGIEVEVEFSPLYRGQPLFPEINAFLRDRGFALFDITTPPGRKTRKTVPGESTGWKGQALWTDALYFRDFVAEGYCPNALTREKAAKTLALAELHGFGDFAIELLDFYAGKGIVADADCGTIRDMLLSPGRARFRPERELYRNTKRTAAEFLHDRFPVAHRLISEGIARYRGR